MRVNNFLLGCDPEFAVINNEGDVVSQHHNFRHEGPVGWDHGGWVLEVRPEPAFFTRTLVRRIGRLLKDERVVALPKVRAGAFYSSRPRNVSFGGHVHLDLCPYMPPQEEAPWVPAPGQIIEVEAGQVRNALYRQQVQQAVQALRRRRGYSPEHNDRVSALDCLTMQLEHLDILPQRESESRRASTDYGRYGDVRVQGRPPQERTEYRTMASWLSSPSVAMLCLTGAKLAATDPKGMEMFSGYDGLKNWVEKYKEDKDAGFLKEFILSKPLKTLQVDPEEDFRERWRKVGGDNA